MECGRRTGVSEAWREATDRRLVDCRPRQFRRWHRARISRPHPARPTDGESVHRDCEKYRTRVDRAAQPRDPGNARPTLLFVSLRWHRAHTAPFSTPMKIATRASRTTPVTG